MIKEITPQIAYLYFEQKCDIEWSPSTNLIGIQAGEIWKGHYINTVLRFVANKQAKITPYLRKLSSITEDEAQEVFSIRYGSKEHLNHWPSALHWWHDLSKDELWVREVQVGSPSVWLYLLSKGFDLFGLIDNGIAKEIPSPE